MRHFIDSILYGCLGTITVVPIHRKTDICRTQMRLISLLITPLWQFLFVLITLALIALQHENSALYKFQRNNYIVLIPYEMHFMVWNKDTKV
jgi:hypothetical protein